MLLFLLVVVGVVSIVADRYLRAQVPAVPPKPFGLEAYEAHDLQMASGDVVRAVVATITFLGHPFTVVEEAAEAKVAANARAASALAQAENDREGIRDLEANITSLESMATISMARASRLDVLVAKVNSAVGK